MLRFCWVLMLLRDEATGPHLIGSRGETQHVGALVNPGQTEVV